jgi:hypothetical protein
VPRGPVVGANRGPPASAAMRGSRQAAVAVMAVSACVEPVNPPAPASAPETAGLGRGLGPGRGIKQSSAAVMAVAARIDPAACQPAGHKGPPYR